MVPDVRNNNYWIVLSNSDFIRWNFGEMNWVFIHAKFNLILLSLIANSFNIIFGVWISSIKGNKFIFLELKEYGDISFCLEVESDI